MVVTINVSLRSGRKHKAWGVSLRTEVILKFEPVITGGSGCDTAAARFAGSKTLFKYLFLGFRSQSLAPP